jgi:hypothetical protein
MDRNEGKGAAMMSVASRLVVCMVLASAIALGGCTPDGGGTGTQPDTQVEVSTYGAGGENLLGGALAIRAGLEQTVEVILNVDEPEVEGDPVNNHEFILRYSQEPVE